MFVVSHANTHLRWFGRKCFERVAEANITTAGANIITGAIVEVRQRNTGNAHVARSGRLHRLANNLRGVGNRNQFELFAKGAHQNWFPETFDSIAGLSVLVTPVQKRMSGVWLRSQCEGRDGPRDYEL